MYIARHFRSVSVRTVSGVWALSVLVYRKRARVRQDAAIATYMASHQFISLLYYLYELDNNGHETWCTHGRSLLDGLSDVRDTQNKPPEVQNIEHLKFKMDTALEDKYIRGWTCQINNRNENPILRICAKFKSNFITKPYLTSLRVKRYQMNIAQFPPSRYRKRSPSAPRHRTTRGVISSLHKRQGGWLITFSSPVWF